MKLETARAARAPRADAARNRERLLGGREGRVQRGRRRGEPGGGGARAGVGIGTLYRHFPTREALFEAVYRREVDELAALAEHLRTPQRRRRLCADG